MLNKKNDWLATIINQPDFSINDMYTNGITPSNTEMKTRDYYKNIPAVIEQFSENGKFDENKFNNFYQSSLIMYNKFSNDVFENSLLEEHEFSPNAWYAPKDSRIRDVGAMVVKEINPERRSFGIKSLKEMGNSNLSIREIAQTNKVFDYETGVFLDWTPNDKGGLFKSLSRPALVLAQWDEDGEHIINGRTFKHSAGEYKLNEQGENFYETLGNREGYDKDILQYSDTITVDGSWWNKYDFFDSDGLDKNIGGTVMKTIFTVGPMLIPKVGKVFGAISAANALSQILPTLGKSLNGIITGDNTNDVGNFLTKWENYTSRFKGSTSDYSREHMVSMENLGNLVQDVSLQLFQQRVIGEIPRLLRPGNELLAKNVQLGRNLSLAYMAATSSQETYAEFKKAGASDRVAGLGMLASIGAMYRLMNMDYFRDVLFKGSYLDESIIKDPANFAINATKNALPDLVKNTSKKESIKQLGKLSSIFNGQTSKAAQKLAKSTLLNRAVNEAVEETMEEFSADAVKAMFIALDSIGIPMNTNNVSLDFDYSMSDVLQRYGMSFVGGFIGGPIFELHNRWEGVLNGDIIKKSGESSMEELVYLIRNGRADEIRDYYSKLYKKGKLGNTNLSGTKYELIGNDANGSLDENAVAQPVDDSGSQNDLVYNVLMNHIDYVENIMNEEGLKLPESEIFASLQNLKEGKDYDPVLNAIINSGIHTSIFNDVNKISTEIVKTRAELTALIDKNEKNASTQEERKIEAEQLNNNLEIKKLQEKLNVLREKRNEITNGDRSDYYAGQSIFVLDEGTHKFFVDLSKENFTRLKYKINYNSLNEEQRNNVDLEFAEYLNGEGKSNMFRAYDVYLNASERWTDRLNLENVNLEKVQVNKAYKNELVGKLIVDNQSKISQLRENIKMIETKEIKSEDDLNNLEKYNSDLNKVIEEQQNLISDTSLILMQQWSKDSNFIERITNDSIIDNNSIQQLAKDIEEYYTHLQTNNIVSKGNDELDLLFNVIRKHYINIKPSQRLENYIVDNELSFEEERVSKLYNREDGKTAVYSIYDATLMNAVQTELFSLIQEFERKLGVNNSEALSVYNNMIELLKEKTQLSDKQITDLLNEMLPKIGEEPIMDYIDKINKIRSKVKTSSFIDLLEDFDADVNGEPSKIINLLKSEQERLSSTDKITDYIIENNFVEIELEEALKLINTLQALVNGAYSGLNSRINTYRDGNEKPLLAEIENNTASILNSDAVSLALKIQMLLALSKNNKQQRLRIQKDIAVNMRPKFIKSLIDNPMFTNQFNEMFLKGEPSLEDIWNQIEVLNKNNITLETVNDTNYHIFEQGVIEFETKLYNIMKKYNDPEELSTKLVSLFSKDLYKMVSTKLSTEENNVVEEYDLLTYVASIISVSSQDYHAKLYEVLTGDDAVTTEDVAKKKYAPIFAQEHTIRLGYSMTMNTPLFNNIIAKLLDSAESIEEYTKNKTKLYNTYFTFGGAGTGKTTAVGYNLRKMLDGPDTEFITLAPEQEQVDKLASALGLEDSQKFTKNQLFEMINSKGEPLTNDNGKFNKDTGHIELINFDISDTDPFTTSKTNKILFIDEASFFTEYEYDILTQFAVKNNIMIIGFGDFKQNSATFKIVEEGKKSTYTLTGLEDTFHIKSPSLTASLRASNIGKLDNYNIINTVLEKVIYEYQHNPEWEDKDISKKVTEYIANGINLKYYEKEQRFVGEKFVETDAEVISYINKLKERGKVVVITDNDKINKYQSIEGIRIINSLKVQGGEFDYVVIDKDWSANVGVNQTSNTFMLLRDLYTLTQRSKVGTIIKDNGIKKDLFITNNYDVSANGISSLSDEEVVEFKNWRLSALKDIKKSDNFESNMSKTIQDPPLNKPFEDTTINTNDTSTKKPVNTENTTVLKNDEKIKETKNVKSTSLNPFNETDSNYDSSQNLNDDSKIDPIVSDKSEIETEISNDDVLSDKEKQVSGKSNTTTIIESKPINDDIMKVVNNSDTTGINNDDYNLWTYRQLLPYENNENQNSLYKLISNKVDSGKYIKTIRLIADVIKNNKSVDIIKKEIGTLLVNGKKVQSFINSLNDKYELHVLHYKNNSAIMVARFKIQGSDKVVDIPIAILNTTDYGKYNGKFTKIKGVTYNKENTRQSVGNLTYDGRFKIASNWVILSKTYAEIKNILASDKYDTGVKEFLKRNLGKPFVLLTDDMSISDDDFDTMLKSPQYTDETMTYLVKDDNDFTFVGVQNTATFSEICKFCTAMLSKIDSVSLDFLKSIGLTENKESDVKIIDSVISSMLGDSLSELSAPLTTADKSKWKELYTKIHSNEYQILPEGRMRKFVTSLLILSKKNKTFHNTLLNNLTELLKKKPSTSSNGNTNQNTLSVSVEGNEGVKSYLIEGIFGKDHSVDFKISEFNNETKVVNKEIKTFKANEIKSIEFPITLLTNYIRKINGINIDAPLNPRTFEIEIINKVVKPDKSTGYYTRKANDTIYNLIKGISNLDILDEDFSQDDYFKSGIFINDIGGKPIGSFRNLTSNKLRYTTDAGNIEGSIYSINNNLIEKGSPEQIAQNQEQINNFEQQVSIINKLLKDNNISYNMPTFKYKIDTDFNNRLMNLIDDINNSIKVFDGPNYKKLINKDGKFEVITIKDNKGFIEQLLKKNNIDYSDIIEISESKSLNYLTFLVSLSDNNQVGYIINKNQNNWELSEFKSFNSFNQIHNKIEDLYLNSDKYEISKEEATAILNYFENIQLENMSLVLSQNYIDVVENHFDKLEAINEEINNYLIERIKNNEC